MLAKIKGLTSLASQVWQIISFILPLMEAIKRITEWVQELDDEGKEKEEKDIIKNIVMELYDIINDVTDDDLPIGRETFKRHLGNLIDLTMTVLKVFGIFSRKGEENQST